MQPQSTELFALSDGILLVTGELPAQKISTAENICNHMMVYREQCNGFITVTS